NCDRSIWSSQEISLSATVSSSAPGGMACRAIPGRRVSVVVRRRSVGARPRRPITAVILLPRIAAGIALLRIAAGITLPRITAGIALFRIAAGITLLRIAAGITLLRIAAGIA